MAVHLWNQIYASYLWSAPFTSLAPAVQYPSLKVCTPSLSQHFKPPGSDVAFGQWSLYNRMLFFRQPSCDEGGPSFPKGPAGSPPWTSDRAYVEIIQLFTEHLIWATCCSQYSVFISSLILTTALCRKYCFLTLQMRKQGSERLSYLPTLINQVRKKYNQTIWFHVFTSKPHWKVNGPCRSRFSKWPTVVRICHVLTSVKFLFTQFIQKLTIEYCVVCAEDTVVNKTANVPVLRSLDREGQGAGWNRHFFLINKWTRSFLMVAKWKAGYERIASEVCPPGLASHERPPREVPC